MPPVLANREPQQLLARLTHLRTVTGVHRIQREERRVSSHVGRLGRPAIRACEGEFRLVEWRAAYLAHAGEQGAIAAQVPIRVGRVAAPRAGLGRKTPGATLVSGTKRPGAGAFSGHEPTVAPPAAPIPTAGIGPSRSRFAPLDAAQPEIKSRTPATPRTVDTVMSAHSRGVGCSLRSATKKLNPPAREARPLASTNARASPMAIRARARAV